MSERYAVYFAPSEGSSLGQFGSAILGRTASAERSTDAGSSFESVEHWRAATTSPAHYGFHATLKAPFTLAPSQSRDTLLAAVAELASQLNPIELEGFKPRIMQGFVALTPKPQALELVALASRCVVELDKFRAPLAPADLQRRMQAPLSDKQVVHLQQWGYPYVLDEFRFHMTLSNKLCEQQQLSLLKWMQNLYLNMVNEPPEIDNLAVFYQAERSAAFTCIDQFLFDA